MAAPSLPVPRGPEPLSALGPDLQQARWEVRVKTEDRDEADRLERMLWRRGRGTGRIESTRMSLTAETEVDARLLAGEARRWAGLAEIEVRPIGRLRRWWLRNRIYGNYGGG